VQEEHNVVGTCSNESYAEKVLIKLQYCRLMLPHRVKQKGSQVDTLEYGMWPAECWQQWRYGD